MSLADIWPVIAADGRQHLKSDLLLQSATHDAKLVSVDSEEQAEHQLDL